VWIGVEAYLVVCHAGMVGEVAVLWSEVIKCKSASAIVAVAT